jgi:hypothetical protein
MRIESWLGAATVLLVMFGRIVAAEPQQCRRSPIPSNVELAHDLEKVLARIYERSPAFRAQCERIASAGNLRVTVRIDTSIPAHCRAFTIIHRRGDNITADVHLPASNGLIELVGHEFEHLLEQIEGLDLRRLARVKGSGVHEREGRMFETDRARAAGRVVAAEMSRQPRAPAAD